jgi:tetratricopeptide (TPR) repeat protein
MLMFSPTRFTTHWLMTFISLVSLTCAAAAQIPGSSRPAPVMVEIQGQVRYADGGAPAERVLVRVEGFGSGVNGQAMTDSSGKFRFSGLGQAQYVVTVRAPGYVEARQQVDLQTMPRAYLNFQIVPEKKEITPLPVASGMVDARVPPEAQKEFETGRRMLIDEKKVEDGVAHLEKAISLYPAFLDAHLLLGTAYMDNKQLDKAERELRKTIEISPKTTAAHFALGEVYRQQQKYAEAEKVLQDGLQLDPKSPQGHFVLGEVYFAKGEIARAGPEVGQALQLKPDYAEAYLLAGNLFLRARNAANALQMFEEYLRLDPKGPFATQAREMVQKIKLAMAEKKK